MTGRLSSPGVSSREPGAPDRRRAWLSLLLYPLSLVAAFVVGEGLASLLGHPAGQDETAPLWAILVASVPALVVFTVPGLVAFFFSRRAARAGATRPWTPAVVGAAVVALFVLQNVAAYVVQSLGG